MRAAVAGEQQRAGEVVRGVALAVRSAPQRKDEVEVLALRGVDDATEVARVVVAEVGVDEQQEVDAVVERALQQQLDVRTLAHGRLRRAEDDLSERRLAPRETLECVVVALLVRQGQSTLVRGRKQRRAELDAIGELDDSVRFVASRYADEQSGHCILRDVARRSP